MVGSSQQLTYEKKSDIEKIAKKYNIAICFNGFDNKEESATFKQENSVACYFNGDEGDWGDSIALTFYVDDNKTFDNIDDLISDYIEIELWKYNPSVYTSDEMVDIVSLVQSLKDVEDERVEMQIEEIMEEYKW